jgi:hypothetical protein
MTVLTRRQFRQHWEAIIPGLTENVLWLVEESYNKKSRWFVCTRPLETKSELIVDGLNPKQDYWLWCHRHCAGLVICYSSSPEEEWWGFSHRADIVLWMLKWAR